MELTFNRVAENHSYISDDVYAPYRHFICVMEAMLGVRCIAQNSKEAKSFIDRHLKEYREVTNEASSDAITMISEGRNFYDSRQNKILLTI